MFCRNNGLSRVQNDAFKKKKFYNSSFMCVNLSNLVFDSIDYVVGTVILVLKNNIPM